MVVELEEKYNKAVIDLNRLNLKIKDYNLKTKAKRTSAVLIIFAIGAYLSKFLINNPIAYSIGSVTLFSLSSFAIYLILQYSIFQSYKVIRNEVSGVHIKHNVLSPVDVKVYNRYSFGNLEIKSFDEIKNDFKNRKELDYFLK